MDLLEYRDQINEIDDELVRLFQKRLEVCGEIGLYKKEHGLPVFDAARERAKLMDVSSKLGEPFKEYGVSLYSLIFELARSYEGLLMNGTPPLVQKISESLETTPKLFPERVVVACQGVEGAYQQMACDRLFKMPNILYFKSFGDVFNAIDKGLCKYGVIPVENSTAGSVNAVYDLMMEHNFHIVRSVRVKIDHNLLVKPGVKLEEIREIYSHEQAINQCSRFLSTLPGVKVIPCANTAMAAKMVAESDRRDVAALSSRACIELYGLQCLAASVQDQGSNFTRFICITKELEIFPGADRTSLMVVLPHKPGSLCRVLSRFYALGINLNKLESRPVPERNFEFMFYFDLETSVYSPSFLQLMGELDDICEEYTYLGSYNEVI